VGSKRAGQHVCRARDEAVCEFVRSYDVVPMLMLSNKGLVAFSCTQGSIETANRQ
jgi:hypothetical protein